MNDQDMLETVPCTCGQEICVDWQPDETGCPDLVTYIPRLRDGAITLYPADRCRCGRLLTYQWYDRAVERSERKRVAA